MGESIESIFNNIIKPFNRVIFYSNISKYF